MTKLTAASRGFIGCKQAHTVLYLHTAAPTLPEHYERLDAASLTQQILHNNNNNWRKILTIYAKLTAPDDDWRNYLKEGLLATQQINFGAQLFTPAKQHIIAGQANWRRFSDINFRKDVLNQQKRQFITPNILICPYPDYRQFPNSLVAECRDWLNQPSQTAQLVY